MTVLLPVDNPRTVDFNANDALHLDYEIISRSIIS
jgi:hypothetical protein